MNSEGVPSRSKIWEFKAYRVCHCRSASVPGRLVEYQARHTSQGRNSFGVGVCCRRIPRVVRAQPWALGGNAFGVST